MPACPVCGDTNPVRAEFCMTCGTRLPPPSAGGSGGIRRTVTVVFCDVVGSTPLGERLDPESVRTVMTRFFERMRDVLERHGGTVEKYIGDAVMAVFGATELHEDDALRAVRAAAEMRGALVELNADLEPSWGVSITTRMGVNTGQVVVGDPNAGPLVIGDAVNAAARLEQAARPGEILLGASTFELVRDAVSVGQRRTLTLRGKAEPMTCYLLEGVDQLPRAALRLHPAFVGRTDELEALDAALQRSIKENTCVLLTVLGVAGVGKSRLVDEFTASNAGSARVVGGRCLPYGDGITFWPVAELVRDACHIVTAEGQDQALRKARDALAGAADAAAIVDGLAAVSGFGERPVTVQETFWAVRRFLEVLSRDRPTVVLFDDLQWAEPTFLDLVEYLVGRAREVPMLIVCMARPEMLDLRPAWSTAQPNASTVSLDPLSAADSGQLIGDLLGASALDAQDSARIVEAAEGNPLFLEEMLRMLEDDGLLSREEGRWRIAGDGGPIAVPASIHALLATRLDRLSPDEQAVLGTAAVIGKEFWWGAVADLLPEDVQPAVANRLQTLVRKGLIVPARSTLTGQDAFAFHHILIRDASYETLSKERRASLHEQFADWVVDHLGDRILEYDEVIGHHLEQACLYRREIGLDESQTERLAARGGGRLASAGRRALARGDMAAATTLLGRATALHASDVTARAALLPDLGEALMQAGELARAAAALDEAIGTAELVGDRGLRSHAAMVRFVLMESTDPKGLAAAAQLELTQVIPVFEDLGDDLGLARAWRLQGDLHWTRGRYAAAGEALERAIRHATAAGSAWERAELMGQYTGAGVYGPTPVDEVVARCEEVLAQHEGNRVVAARALRSLAALRAMQGRFDEAREHAARAATILEDLGMWLPAAFASETRGFVERLAGDLQGAEAALRAGHEVIARMEEQGYQSTVAALLAQVLAAQGRPDAAEPFIDEATAAAAADDVTTHVLVSAARGRVSAERGSFAKGESLCQQAVALAETTDDLNMQADALLDLAHVQAGRGAERGALAAAERARRLFEAKGNVVQAEGARAFVP